MLLCIVKDVIRGMQESLNLTFLQWHANTVILCTLNQTNSARQIIKQHIRIHFKILHILELC